MPFIDFAKTLEETTETFDYIILGCKNKDLPNAIDSASAFLTSQGKFILIQNGLPESDLKFPKERIIGGVVGWNTQKQENNIYFQSNQGALILGGADSSIPDFLLKRILEPYIPTILTNNLLGYRWHKLGINSVINGLAASCKLTLGNLMLNVHGRNLSIKVLTEIKLAMEKIQIKEMVVPGSVSIERLGDGKGALPKWVRHLILILLGLKYYKIKTSMVQDLEANRITEIDDINGRIVKISRNIFTDAKINEAITNQVKLLEKNQIKPDLQFLKDLDQLN